MTAGPLSRPGRSASVSAPQLGARGGPGLSGFDWRTIRTRLLFVHHVDDACVATPHFMAQRVAAGRTLVSVRGGAAPRSEPCEAFGAHGFLGVEASVVDAIVRWMRGEAPPAMPAAPCRRAHSSRRPRGVGAGSLG